MVKLPKGMGMVDTAMPKDLAELITKPNPEWVWVIEEMASVDGAPWLHVFAKGEEALIVLCQHLKMKKILAGNVPLLHTWCLYNYDGDVVGVLYHRPVHIVGNIFAMADSDNPQ